jgi:hypothetical protein
MAAKPSEAERDRITGTKLHVVRDKRRKTSVEEMFLSMEVVPDRAAAGPSRARLWNDLGAARTCGPLRRDSQASMSGRLDGHDTGSVDGERGGRITPPCSRREANANTFDPPEPLRRRETAGCSIARPTGGNSSRAGGVGGAERLRSCEARPHRERTRHGCSRLKQQMAETGRTHHA